MAPDPPLGRAVDARVGPAPLPAVEVGLGVVEPLEAEAAQRRLLRVADAGLDLALSVGVTDATRQGDDAVVGQHVAVERIERPDLAICRGPTSSGNRRRSGSGAITQSTGQRPTSRRGISCGADS